MAETAETDQFSEGGLLHELEPVIESLLDRHDQTKKVWYPHKFVPWSRGRDFEPDYEWDPTEVQMPDAVRKALVINLLTEDGLPYYYATLDREGGADKGWQEWDTPLDKRRNAACRRNP